MGQSSGERRLTSGLHHQTQISAPRPSSPVDLVPSQTRWIPDVRPFTSDLAAPDPNFSLSVPIASVPSSRSVPGMRPPTSLPTYPDSNRSPSFPTCWELRPAQSLVGDPSHSPSPQIQTSTPQSPPTRVCPVRRGPAAHPASHPGLCVSTLPLFTSGTSLVPPSTKRRVELGGLGSYSGDS